MIESLPEWVAFHEAGHAVAALALGSDPVQAHMWAPDDGKMWRGITWHSTPPSDGRRVVVDLAGLIAQLMIGERLGWFVEPFELTRADLLPLIAGEVDGRVAETMSEEDFAASAQQANEILTKHWSVVEALATALMMGRAHHVGDLPTDLLRSGRL